MIRMPLELQSKFSIRYANDSSYMAGEVVAAFASYLAEYDNRLRVIIVNGDFYIDSDDLGELIEFQLRY
jgi:NDP-sugar pyrophosphorylase family protein